VEHKATEKQNITLSFPRPLLRKFKRIAVDRGKSVSALLRELMEEAVRQDDSYERAYRHWREDMKNIRDLGTYGKITCTRDELHERHR